MPKVLILVAHRPNRSPSQRYRFEQYLPFLKSKGYSFTWSPLLNEKDDVIFYSKGAFIKKIIILIKMQFIRMKDVRRFKAFDIIFIQREASFIGTSYFEKKAKQSGKKVIFDFDDAIWLADTSPGNKKWAWVKWPGKFKNNVAYASTVIAGNTFLANKALHYNKKVQIIPTTVNTDWHIPKPHLRNKQTLVIGWSGSISTIKHFEEIIPVLLRIKEIYKQAVSFSVIGDAQYTHQGLGIVGKAWCAETEVEDLNAFDIGIMPLPENKWTEGKCGLKALCYMACEVPVILSAVGVNKNIVQNNTTGMLVNTHEEWFLALCLLIENEALRNKLGKKARAFVIDKYAVKANEHKYLTVFKNA